MDSLPGGQIYENWTRLQKLIWSYLKNNLFVLYFYKCYNYIVLCSQLTTSQSRSSSQNTDISESNFWSHSEFP